MISFEFTTLITAVASVVANEQTPAELGILAAAFTQLGDTLATIAALSAEE